MSEPQQTPLQPIPIERPKRTLTEEQKKNLAAAREIARKKREAEFAPIDVDSEDDVEPPPVRHRTPRQKPQKPSLYDSVSESASDAATSAASFLTKAGMLLFAGFVLKKVLGAVAQSPSALAPVKEVVNVTPLVVDHTTETVKSAVGPVMFTNVKSQEIKAKAPLAYKPDANIDAMRFNCLKWRTAYLMRFSMYPVYRLHCLQELYEHLHLKNTFT
ncbi:hypothetical protein CAOG_009457 [Capsaspora owczarzaki ATCC 30864]|uniref:Uncharacterized protein n=1 Tax=Capsaspora owczarzaki (strain ATCC 30864) TaxID=595528 RepID=A0A0D2VK88_CAPO3|nr:hypothetical protein CAOG_009457 [Capsaspora owczarzaki ATCC 30864]